MFKIFLFFNFLDKKKSYAQSFGPLFVEDRLNEEQRAMLPSFRSSTSEKIRVSYAHTTLPRTSHIFIVLFLKKSSSGLIPVLLPRDQVRPPRLQAPGARPGGDGRRPVHFGGENLQAEAPPSLRVSAGS